MYSKLMAILKTLIYVYLFLQKPPLVTLIHYFF